MTDLILSVILLALVCLALRSWRKRGGGGCKGCPHAAKCRTNKEDPS